MKKRSLLLFLLTACSAFTLFASTSCKDDSATSSNSSTIDSIGEIGQDPFLSLNKTELNDFVIGDSQIIFADFAEQEGVSLSWDNSNATAVQMEVLNKYSCKVTAMREGEATITATYGTLKKTCMVKVGLNNLYPSLEFTTQKEGVVNIFPNSKLDLSTYVAFNGKQFDDAEVTYTVADNTFGTIDKETKTFNSLSKLGQTSITVSAKWRGVASELLKKTVNVKVVAPKTVVLKDSDDKNIQEFNLYTVASFEGKSYKNEQAVSSILVQEANVAVEDYTIAITDSVAGDGSDTPVAVWDSVNKKVVANTYGSAKLTVSFNSPATGEPFVYSFAITAERPVAEYKTPIQNFSWILGDIPVESIFAGGSTAIVNAEQDGRALKVVDNRLTDVIASSHTQMSEETVIIYNDKVGYILRLETYAMAITSVEEFRAYFDSNEPRTITGYFELKKDITMEEPWQFSAQKNDSQIMVFAGVFNGNGHTLTVPMRTYGVFGDLRGTLKNLHMHVTGVSSRGTYKTTSVISQATNAGAKVTDMYVTLDLAKEADFSHTFSLFGSSDNSFVMQNFVADLGAKIPETGYAYGMYGLLFQYISYVSSQGVKEQLYDNVYLISSGLKMLVSRHDKVAGSADNNNIYAGNDTALYDAYTPVAGENKYKINTISRYATYADFVASENTYEDFNADCWQIIDGGLYWNGAYEKGVQVVATDETGKTIQDYLLETTTDEIKLSLADMYGNAIDGVEYTIVNGDTNLTNENGTFSLVSAVADDKDYTVVLKAVLGDVTIERTVVIKAIVETTVYTQEVYLATNADYAGADTYVLKNAGFDALPTGITGAILNGVTLTVTDGKLPDITMRYIKKFENYGKSRETYMDIYVGETVIISKKAEQTPVSLIIKTGAQALQFTNLFICTDVIETATDLNRFSIVARDENERTTYTNSGYYVMVNNIDAKDLNFAHKNNAYDISRRFVGSFDGRGYTISNLNVNQDKVGVTGNTDVYGLFGNLYGADIINVGFVNVSAEGGSVLGSVSSYVASSFCEGDALPYAEDIYPAKMSNGYVYVSTRIENVYIKVADSVTAMKGALAPAMSDYNYLTNVVVEWNPTNATALSAGYGSFIGSGTFPDGAKPKRENVIVLSSVQLNNEMATCLDVTVYESRAKMQSENTASLSGFTTYWTVTDNAPVWKTASWQNNN